MTSYPIRKADLLWQGILIGVVGGIAEIAVVCSFTALSGGNAATVARGIAYVVGLDGMSAGEGVAVHMGLAAMLGVALLTVLRMMPLWATAGHALPFMLFSLAMVWVINFFVVLPAMGSGFTYLLPNAVTLASKLSFGLTAAIVLSLKDSGSSARSTEDNAIGSGTRIMVGSAGIL